MRLLFHVFIHTTRCIGWWDTHRRGNHLGDLLLGKEVGEDDGVERRDVRVPGGLEEGLDLLGRDVRLFVLRW